MADEKNVTLEQFKGFMTKADERLDKLEVGKENKVSPVSITIPTEGWASEEIGETDEEGTEASYPFYYDIAAADVTAKHRADVTISRESLDAATVCGLCPTSETTEGEDQAARYEGTDGGHYGGILAAQREGVIHGIRTSECSRRCRDGRRRGEAGRSGGQGSG